MHYIVLVTFLFTVAGAASSQTKAPANARQTTSPVAKDTAESATQVADKFLEGAKTIELPDGKKAISESSWPIRRRVNLSVPIFNHYVVVGDGMFDTDVSGVRGFKRLVDIEARNEAGATLTKRYMLFLYQNRNNQRWKVLSFAESQDTDEAVRYFRDDWPARDTFGGPRTFGYDTYMLALVLIDAGKVHQARETFKSALDFAKREDATQTFSVPENEVQDYLVALQAITGE